MRDIKKRKQIRRYLVLIKEIVKKEDMNIIKDNVRTRIRGFEEEKKNRKI